MKISFPFSIALVALVITGCSSPYATFTAEQPVEIQFLLMAHNSPVQCGQEIKDLGVTGVSAQLHDARFYLQDIALLNSKGDAVPLNLTINDWQDNNTVLLDFENSTGQCKTGTPETNHAITGTIAAGRYNGIIFTMGVAQERNHSSTELTSPPLDIAAMGWGWQAGRKFAKIEINPSSGVMKPDGSRSATWYLHLGSNGCTGNPFTGEIVECLGQNRVPVSLTAFNPVTQSIVLDLAILLSGSDLTTDSGGPVGCMSARDDADCLPVFKQLGLSLATGQPLPSGYVPAFRIENK